VDIVGSTALKQSGVPSSREDKRHWIFPITSFYREIDRLLAEKWRTHVGRIPPTFHWELGDLPTFWKSAGDELIYVQLLTDHRQVYSTIKIWIEAINEHRTSLREKHGALDLKATAWLAGFPITNSEIIFQPSKREATPSDDPHYENQNLLIQYYENGDASKGMLMDYIGPSVDTGFRVSTLSTPRKMALSLETAFLLASVGSVNDAAGPMLDLYYDGRRSLKGVLADQPYPFFWVNCLGKDDVAHAEAQLLDNGAPQKPANYLHAVSFCKAFMAENPHFFTRPYIFENPDKAFRGPHQDHEMKLEQMSKAWNEKREAKRAEFGALRNQDFGEGREERPSSAEINSFTSKLTPKAKSKRKRP
jgi:hypothetical protein